MRMRWAFLCIMLILLLLGISAPGPHVGLVDRREGAGRKNF